MASDINQTLEDLQAAIVLFTEKSGQCCAPKGSKTEAGPSSETPSYGGVEDEYPDAEAYFNARCNAANGIFDTVSEFVQWLEDNHVALKAGAFGGLTTGLVVALVSSGPVGWGVVAAGSAVTTLVIWIIKESLDFDDLGTALDDVHDELVVAMYSAQDVPIARSNFLTILEGASPAPSTQELFLIKIILTADILNNLFTPRSDLASYTSPSPVDCGSFILQTWSFAASGESWAFRDDSTSGYSATGAWNAGAEAWRLSITGSGTGTGLRGKGTIYITGLALSVEVGNSVQVDYGETSDGVSMSAHIKIIYSDASEQEIMLPGGSGPVTRILSVDRTEVIEELEISSSRSWGTPFTDVTRDIEEVRVQ